MKEPHVLLPRIADAGRDVVVVGGCAGVLHDSAYVTDDLDICTTMSPETAAVSAVATMKANSAVDVRRSEIAAAMVGVEALISIR